MRRHVWVVAVLAVVAASAAARGSEDWTHLGGGASRQSIAAEGPTRFVTDPNQGYWMVDEDPCTAGTIEFEGATGPIVCAGKVFAYARCVEDPNYSQLAAWDAQSGRPLWSRLIDPDWQGWGSWSSPCVDESHNSVLIGSGYRVFAFDANTGEPRWESQLQGPVVNASVCVATDLPHVRAFITDANYSFGQAVEPKPHGHLYCINLDANEPNNPYDPGQVLWAYPLGETLGNSPSYLDGTVYVASRSGRIYAFDAAATSVPATPLWDTPVSSQVTREFYGGVAITRNETADGVKRFLYAASSDSASSKNNSIMVKLDCQDGRIVWSTDVECTDTIPVVSGDRIFVSGGLAFLQSKLKVQAFQDKGEEVEALWDTSVDLPDTSVGGWTAQPVYAAGKLYVGAVAQGSDYFTAYDRLYILDVNRRPGDEGFMLDYVDGCGNSPAITGDGLYSIGLNALMRFPLP